MNQPHQPSWRERTGVPTLMPDAAQLGTPGPGVMIGNFELQTVLGRGGMGEVWKAWDKEGERPVVIKLVPPELQRAEEELARVRETFQRVHALQHQHICPLYLLSKDPRFGWYVVMKFIDGQTLSAYRLTYAARHGSFPVRQLVKVLRPVAEALDYAHRQKVIHRDIKPKNILVVGEAEDVQVVDFGLAAEIRTTVSRYTRVQMDTSANRPYMAPEQWKGQIQDAATDQYALAATAYELLAGHLPFESDDFDILRACVLNDPPAPCRWTSGLTMDLDRQRSETELAMLRENRAAQRELDRLRAVQGLGVEALVATSDAANAETLARMKMHEATQAAAQEQARSGTAHQQLHKADQQRLYERLIEAGKSQAEAIAQAYREGMAGQQAIAQTGLGAAGQATRPLPQGGVPPAAEA